MFSTLRTRFGIPGVISVMALAFAMLGGAYAAQSNDSSKATASAKAKKGPRGPKGPKGDTGPAGPQGPAGPAGGKGDAGAKGDTGATGATGPTGAQGPKGATGAAGATGPAGKDGETGFTETLPPGKTETGTWSFNIPPVAAQAEIVTTISFPIPLASAGKASFFTPEEVANEEFGTTGCKWEQFNVNAKPESTKPGTLCVFAEYGEGPISFQFFQTPGELSEVGYGPSGIFMFFEKSSTKEPERMYRVGTWAVTAP